MRKNGTKLSRTQRNIIMNNGFVDDIDNYLLKQRIYPNLRHDDILTNKHEVWTLIHKQDMNEIDIEINTY